MKKCLFLLGQGTKDQVKKSWDRGAAFQLEENPRVFISNKNIDQFRVKCERVIIQYDNGTLEV